MIRTVAILLLLCFTCSLAGQTRLSHPVADLLPKNAQIIETANVPVRLGKARLLVLWMSAPCRVISSWDSAADFLYGNHWLGPTFLSLIDPSNGKLINTVKVHPSQESPDDDGLAIPFFTNDGYYQVPHPDKDGRGTPLLLRLRDLTGEGIAGQFVLFEHVVSGIAAGSVLGYSLRSDTAVQYLIERTQNKFNPMVKMWAPQIFDSESSRPGYWKFTWEAGHGASDWIDEAVRFDSARQLFVEKQTTRPYPGSAHVNCNLDTASLTNFLGSMREVAPENIKWLSGLIRDSAPNNVGVAGMVPSFNGEITPLDVAYQSSATGTIIIELTTESAFAAVLQAELKTWCAGN